MLNIIISSVGYSIENILAKLAISGQHWDPIQLILKRYSYFGIIVILYLVLFDMSTIQSDFNDLTSLKYPILIGLASLLGGLFLYRSFKSYGLAITVPAVNGSSVLFTTLFGIFVLKESIGIKKIIGILFLLFGLLLTG